MVYRRQWISFESHFEFWSSYRKFGLAWLSWVRQRVQDSCAEVQRHTMQKVSISILVFIISIKT